ncbi:hypothetical protein [uncultured Chryseobacterium sp.]|uniref:hypothetical protein n=1 Tax=uncultured Chryseobacterium sp. TaxID=259322 RepID=UPI0025D877D8|nr:hypothetical protein [uncultured Chryseobacterium sp.]
MKKLLFVATICVAGLTSAKNLEIKKPEAKRETVELKNTENTKQNSLKDLKVALKPIAWIGVSTWCGKVFYLDANDYTSMDELNDAATYFTDQQCSGTFVGQYG